MAVRYAGKLSPMERRAERMRRQRSDNMNTAQDLEEHLYGTTSRLKLNFRSTRCSGQSFPYFNKQWCKENVPCELQELILTHLPALKLLELKAVCRSWRDLLQSSSFKEKWQLMRGGCSYETVDVWVMKSKQEEDLIAYVPAHDKYFLFLSLICSSFVMTQPACTFNLKEVSFLCARGSMILLGKKNWRSVPSFLMYNLHTGEGKHVKELRLQVGHHNEFNAILPSSFPVLIEDKDQPLGGGLAVEIQCVNDNGPQPLNHLLVFKFTTHTWDCYPQSSAIQADFSDMSAVLCGEFFRYDQEESTLYAWSMQHWSKVQVTFSWPPHDMMNRDVNAEVNAFKVVKCEGHILLLASTVEQERGVVAQRFTVWKLMKGAEETVAWNWFELSRTPPDLCLKSFNRENFPHPTAMCDGSRICILSSSHEFSPALVYDVKHGSWYHLHGVFKDMQALFAMKLGVKIDGL